MSTPIERMLDAVEWRVTGVQPDGELPYATHEGILYIGDVALRAYQLSDGQRVIDADDLTEFLMFGAVERATRGGGPPPATQTRGA